jgi:uncharacterized repeat protein (TIGR03803 family)
MQIRQLPLAAIVAGLFATAASAQSVDILHQFDNDTDGRTPDSNGVLSADGSVLYGSTATQFPGGGGTIWKINTDGSDFQVLRTFGGTAATTEGTNPRGELILQQTLGGDKLVGINGFGLPSNAGTLWQMDVDGSNFQVLHAFDPQDGEELIDVRAYDDGFIGVAANDFLNSSGTIWRINSDGSNFQRLKLFTGVSEGRYPLDAPTPVGSTFYGMTALGSDIPVSNSDGTIFRIDDDGSNFSQIYEFPDSEGLPVGRLIETGGYLYGVTGRGGANGDGSIFRFTPDGDADDLEIVFDFDASLGLVAPSGGVSLSPDGTTLWGTTFAGGIDDRGVLFSYNTITDVGELVANLGPVGWGSSASGPGPIFSPDGLTLYGTTATGGLNPGNHGTIWSYTIPEPTSLALLGLGGLALLRRRSTR